MSRKAIYIDDDLGFVPHRTGEVIDIYNFEELETMDNIINLENCKGHIGDYNVVGFTVFEEHENGLKFIQMYKEEVKFI
jgi:hypothetical protein